MAGLPNSAGTCRAEPERWRVERGQGRHAIREWEDVLAATHAGFDVGFTSRTPRHFYGAVTRRRLGDLTLVDCMSAPFFGHYRAAAGDPGEASIGFQVLSVPESRTARRDALRADVRHYIRMNLGDPRLSPQSVATAHALSLRALYGLFENTGESVAALIRRLRLARCLSDLTRPGTGSVTDIAFRWGFTDAAHFSRLFKRQFGVPPRDVRRAVLDDEIAQSALISELAQ